MNNLVNIIMPAYNCQKSVRMAIDSVREQTYSNWRLLIVDDCSTDSTREILGEYCNDHRIFVYHNPVNKGVAFSRNVALDKVSSGLVAFLDSDDYWDKYKLEFQVPILQENDGLIVHSFYKIVNSENKIMSQRKAPLTGGYHELLKGNYIGTSTAIFHFKHLQQNRFPNIGHEDFAFWLLVTREQALCTKCIDLPLVSYRVSNDSLSANKIRAALWTWRVLRQHESLSFVRSFSYFTSYMRKAIINRVKAIC